MRRLRAMEAVALLATVAAVALTALAEPATAAVESNPVAAALLDTLGWTGAGAVAVGAEAALFAGWRRLAARGYQRTALAAGAGVAGVGVADLLVNVVVLSRVGLPASARWLHYGGAVAPVAALAVVILVRPPVRQLLFAMRRVGGRLSGGNLSAARSVLLAAILVLAALSGAVTFGPLPGVSTATAETLLADDFEDGIDANWTGTTGHFTTASDPGNRDTTSLTGSGTGNYDSMGYPTGGDINSVTALAYVTPNTTSAQLGVDDSASGGGDAYVRIEAGGTVKYGYGDGGITSAGSVPDEEWVRIRMYNLNVANNSFDWEVTSPDGSTVHESGSGQFDGATTLDYVTVKIAGSASHMDNVGIDGGRVSQEVSGNVTDAEGSPIGGAVVAVQGESGTYAVTDSSGNYNMSIPGGEQTLLASKQGYGLAKLNVNETTGSDITLNSVTGAEGRVLTGYREAAPGAVVTARDGPQILDKTVADSTGNYTIEVSREVTVSASRSDLKGSDSVTTDTSSGYVPVLYLTESEPAREGYNADVADPLTYNNVENLNTSVISDCSHVQTLSREGEAAVNILTGGISGSLDTLNVVEFGPSRCQPDTEAQERLALLVAGISINQTEQTTEAVLQNYLTDTRGVAYSEGKISAYNAFADGAVAEQAKANANTSVDGYYHSIEDNSASGFSTATQQAKYVYNREFDTNGTTEKWVYPVADDGTRLNFASNPWTTADVNLDQETVQITTYRLSSGEVVTPFPNRTEAPGGGPYRSGPVLRIEGPPETGIGVDGGAYTAIADSGLYGTLVSNVKDQRVQVKDNLATTIDSIYAAHNGSDFNTTEFLTPNEIASRAASNYNDTGYYAFAAAELASRGLAGNVTQSHTLALADGRNVTGSLFYTGSDFTGPLEVGKTYNPGNYSGAFVLAANEEDGGIQALRGNFTVKSLTNTKTGESINATTFQGYTYNTTDTDQLREEIEALQQVAKAYEDAETNTGGGVDFGGFGNVPAMPVAIAVAGGAALLLLSGSGRE